LTLEWGGRPLGRQDVGQLIVFIEGEVMPAQRCRLETLPEGQPPAAVVFVDRRAFLSPGRYIVRAWWRGKAYEAQVVVEAGLLAKVSLSPVGNP